MNLSHLCRIILLGAASSAALATEDTTAPAIIEVEFTPAIIDVSAGPQDLTVQVLIRDDDSGAQSPALVLRNRLNKGTFALPEMQLIAGTAEDGIWQAQVEIPQGTLEAVWELSLSEFTDLAGNQNLDALDRLEAEIGILSGVTELEPPVLSDFTVTSALLDTTLSSDEQVVTFRLTDNVSSLLPPRLYASNIFNRAETERVTATLTSGSLTDGVWQANIPFPRRSLAGQWQIEAEPFFDTAGNRAKLNQFNVDRVFQVDSDNNDNRPPSLFDFTVSPDSIFSNSTERSVTVVMELNDSESGVVAPMVYASSTFNQAQTAAVEAKLIRGNENHGAWQANLTLPLEARSGQWQINAELKDEAGNRNVDALFRFDTTFIVDSGTAPRIPFVAADFDGDRITDLVATDSSNGNVLIRYSRTGEIQVVSADASTDKILVNSDFDGNGEADLAFRLPSQGRWQVPRAGINPTNTTRTVQLGLQAADIPLPGDYDGDQITDAAVWRPDTGLWYVRNSSGSDFNSRRGDGIQRVALGKEGDIPVPADYDGDGIVDVAVYDSRTSLWTIRHSSDGDINEVVFGGRTEDIPVPADYDGDGRADLAYRRPSEHLWWIESSADGKRRATRFGRAVEDVPVVSDYDGDGLADLAVYRPSNQTWYIKNSSRTNFNSAQEDGIQRLTLPSSAKQLLPLLASDKPDTAPEHAEGLPE